MKDNLPLPVEYGMRIILFIFIIFVSLFVDQFCFGMMGPQNAIKTGLAVSLLVANNLIGFLLSYKIITPIFKYHKP
jgi:hypothetical protein